MESNYKKTRCALDACNKKCTILDMDCQCGKKYCVLHRLPETHKCDFDYKTQGRIELRKQLITT